MIFSGKVGTFILAILAALQTGHVETLWDPDTAGLIDVPALYACVCEVITVRRDCANS